MDNTDVGLSAAIRALADVVVPEVGPDHAQATDQLKLTIDYLRFVVERLPHLHQRARLELRHGVLAASTVQSAMQAPVTSPLGEAIDAGNAVLSDPDVSSSRVQQATAKLGAATAQAVRDAASLDEPIRQKVERSALRASLERIAFERSWYLPLRLDPDPHDVRPLSYFLE
ncbi:hypothetical protein QTI33_09885 [Variovorax sp. J22P271]|uniref:hypothetical protein n=1 Tax=Variovorax davisae TaxID=3053515 RepID=UPI00257646D2|nr:hypothetical protein [Variovorax sp. J22P271]MDM0032434.1 hypothetical protein [Variovorax sp. J22P271]